MGLALHPFSTCNVCYHLYDPYARQPRLLGCGHISCAYCLPRVNSCPVCRQPIAEDKIMNLRDPRPPENVLTAALYTEFLKEPRNVDITAQSALIHEARQFLRYNGLPEGSPGDRYPNIEAGLEALQLKFGDLHASQDQDASST